MSVSVTFAYNRTFTMLPLQVVLFSRKIHNLAGGFNPSEKDMVYLSSKNMNHFSVRKGGKQSVKGAFLLHHVDQVDQVRFATKNMQEIVSVQRRDDGLFDATYRGGGQIDVMMTNYYSNLSRVCIAFNPFGFLFLKLREWSHRFSDTPDQREPNFSNALDIIVSAPSFEHAFQHLPDSFRTMVERVPQDELSLAWRGLRDILCGVKVPSQYYSAT